MAALAADSPRSFRATGRQGKFELGAARKIYAGSAVALEALSRVKALAATEVFGGFAIEAADNTAGAAGDKSIDVVEEGIVKDVVVAGSGASAIGTSVYLSTDNDFTVTATGNSLAGRLAKQAVAAGTTWDVYFQSARLRSPA